MPKQNEPLFEEPHGHVRRHPNDLSLHGIKIEKKKPFPIGLVFGILCLGLAVVLAYMVFGWPKPKSEPPSPIPHGRNSVDIGKP